MPLIDLHEIYMQYILQHGFTSVYSAAAGCMHLLTNFAHSFCYSNFCKCVCIANIPAYVENEMIVYNNYYIEAYYHDYNNAFKTKDIISVSNEVI